MQKFDISFEELTALNRVLEFEFCWSSSTTLWSMSAHRIWRWSASELSSADNSTERSLSDSCPCRMRTWRCRRRSSSLVASYRTAVMTSLSRVLDRRSTPGRREVVWDSIMTIEFYCNSHPTDGSVDCCLKCIPVNLCFRFFWLSRPYFMKQRIFFQNSKYVLKSKNRIENEFRNRLKVQRFLTFRLLIDFSRLFSLKDRIINISQFSDQIFLSNQKMISNIIIPAKYSPEKAVLILNFFLNSIYQKKTQQQHISKKL